MILALQLLIIQGITWVLVLSNTPSDPLWVGIAKTTLFRGLLHINVARKLVAEHSMRWQQRFLRYFWASILPVHSKRSSPSVEFPRGSPWTIRYTFDLCFVYPRRCSSSDHLPLPFHLQSTHGTLSLTLFLLFIRSWTNQRPRPRPKTQHITLGPYPYTIHLYK